MNAWKGKKFTCKDLAIECHETTRDSAIFLFNRGQEMITQFPVLEHALQGDNTLRSYTYNLFVRRHTIESCSREDMKIKDLRPRMRKIILKARILEIPEPKTVHTRFGTQTFFL